MSLPTRQRIKKPAEFRRVFSRGRRASNLLTNVVAAPNDLSYVRVGLSVSKRVGSAVTRNLVKRRIRNAFADMHVSEGWDVVVTAKPQSSLVAYSELDEAIQKSIARLGIEISPNSAQVVL